MDTIWLIAQAILNGIAQGGVYSMIGVGLTIIVGVMRCVNYAQGEFLAVGMYLTLCLVQWTGLSSYALIGPVVALVFFLGMAAYSITVRPIIDQPGTRKIVATMGLGYVISNVLQIIFSADYRSTGSTMGAESLNIGPFTVAYAKAWIWVCMIICVSLVYLLLNKTDFGRAMRATSENAVVAESLGINTKKVYRISFALGVSFAGLTGLLLTNMQYVFPTVGDAYKSIAMVALVMGGLGNIPGALISGIIIGITEAIVATFYSNDLASICAYCLLIVVMTFRPNGLFGKGARTA